MKPFSKKLFISLLILCAISFRWIKLNCNKFISDLKKVAVSADNRFNGKEKALSNIKLANITNSNKNKIPEAQKFDFIEHIIQQGDTLPGLEAKYDVRWQVIKKINKISEEHGLEPGRIIYIPVRKIELANN